MIDAAPRERDTMEHDSIQHALRREKKLAQRFGVKRMFLFFHGINWDQVEDNDLIKLIIYSSSHCSTKLSVIVNENIFMSIPAISMIVACVSFPFGWNSDEFRKICGPEANRFEVGLCGIRWAYALAIIGKSFFYDFFWLFYD